MHFFVLCTVAETRDYQLVEFFEEKIGDKLSLDCVPCKWISYDAIAATCVCKYMPPPYNTKSRAKLSRLTITKSVAPEDWFSYPVHLRGQAATYEAGRENLKQLKKDKAYAYSTDNDDHGKEKSAYFTKIFEKTSRQTQDQDADTIMYSSDLDKSSNSDGEDSSAESFIIDDSSVEDDSEIAKPSSSTGKNILRSQNSNISNETLSTKSRTNTAMIKKTSPIQINPSEDEPENTRPSASIKENVLSRQKLNISIETLGVKSRINTAFLKKTLPIQENSCENELENTRPNTSKKENVLQSQKSNIRTETDSLNSKSKTNTSTFRKTSPIQMSAAVSSQNKILSSKSRMINHANTEKEKELRPNRREHIARDIQQHENRSVSEVMKDLQAADENHFPKEILLLHTAIKSLTVEVQMQNEQIRQLRNCIDQTLKIRITGMTVEEFAVKHKISLKLDSLQSLKNFENKLLMNEQCLIDFTISLKHFAEDDMYKTILAILKKMLEREVVMQCTAVRDSKNKYNMKDTTFCKTLFELTCKQCTYDNGKPVTEKNFNRALGSIFNNAKDWDGQRNVRRLTVNYNKRNDKGENGGPSDN